MKDHVTNIILLWLLLPYHMAVSDLLKSSSNVKSPDKFRILGVFSHPGKSHFDVFKPLLEELALRGHDLTVVSYFPRANGTLALPNYHDINLAQSMNIFVNVVDLNQIHHSPLTPYLEQLILKDWAFKCCKDSLQVPEVKKLIASNAHFDLILTEAFNSDCFLGFVHRFKSPFITLSSHSMMPWANTFSNPENPSYVPNIFHHFSSHMNFWERVTNTYNTYLLSLFYDVGYTWPMQSLVEDAFGPGVPLLRKIARNASAILVNTHYSLHGAKPNLPSVVEVGGLHLSSSQSLPDDLQKILDDANEGVLFFSWGSMIKTSSMSQQTLNEILEAIGSIPRKVIWKWENELPTKPDNVIIRKWLPQAAILRHPNVKCYLAHGGLLGVSEGVSAGVPMVIVPMYGDQFHNSAAAENRGVAVVLEWSTLNAKTLRDAIDRVFNDSSYWTNAKLLQKNYNDRPATPLQTAVWWSEYIARGNGGKFLISSAESLAWYQVALIDVGLFISVILCLIVYITYIIFYRLAGLCVFRNNLKTKKEN